MSDIQKQNIGNAGEYYIASRLSAENFIATITLGRAEKYDIIAVSENDRTLKFSVKTRYNINCTDFQLNHKDEKTSQNDFFYVFVSLNEFKLEPDFWIIPSLRVNEVLQKSHSNWLKQITKSGIKHNNNPMRVLSLIPKNKTKLLYPLDWIEETKKYYKNVKQLK